MDTQTIFPSSLLSARPCCDYDRAMEENLREILLGGQSFSWRDEGDGVFSAVLNERVYRIRSIADASSDPFLRSYFDLDYDWKKAREEIGAKDAILREAVESTGLLRLLHQDHWIATISFILSQNNNIKRITGLYDRLSRRFGHEVEPGYFSFPTPEEMAGTSEKELRGLGVGFRAPFILDKRGVLDEIDGLGYDEAGKRLMTIKGIGPKVASCILIFSYQKREGFPLDVWMKKVMAEYYPDKDPSYFHPHEALSQQYLFSWIRSRG